jgi:putative aldouronate transport system substrate-binding protein
MCKSNAALTILLIFSLFLAGCKGGKKESPVAPPGGYGARIEGKNYWLVKYPEPVTLHTVNRDFPSQGVNKFYPGDDLAKNGWTRGLERDLNISLVTDWISSQTDYDTKLNLAIASGDLPDVYRVNATQYKQLYEADMLADITDYIENNISDTVKEIMAYSREVTESAKFEGRLYGMPVYGYGIIGHPVLLFLRHDWMEGKEPPKTIAEFETLMRTFMAEHPGTYGFPLSKFLGEMYYLGPAFKVFPADWYPTADGSIVYGAVQPEMKGLLSTFADWYKKGLIKKDFMSDDYNMLRQDTISGKTGVNLFFQWHGWERGADMIRNLGKDSYMMPYEVPTADGSPAAYPVGFDNEGYLVVNKKCKNIDAALKAWSYIAYISMDSVKNGDKTLEDMEKEYHTAAGSDSHIWFPLQIRTPLNEAKSYLQMQELKKNGGLRTPEITEETWTFYQACQKYLYEEDLNEFGRWIQMYADPSAYEWCYKIINENRYVVSAIRGAVPEEVAAYGSTLGDPLLEGFIKIITGVEPVSYFDTLVANFMASGGEAMIAAMNRDYGKK